MKNYSLCLLLAFSFFATALYSASNTNPVAVDDLFYVAPGTTLFGALLSNDFDMDGDQLSVDPLLVEQPTNGTISICENGSFYYTPNPGFTGTDSFEYQITDDGSPMLSDSAVATIHVEVPTIIKSATRCDEVIFTDCKAVFEVQPCRFELNDLKVTPLDLTNTQSTKALILPNDTCDYLMIVQSPIHGNLFLASPADANLPNADSSFFYQQFTFGPIEDTLVYLKCGWINNVLICDSITVILHLNSDCEFNEEDYYGCLPNGASFSFFPLDNDIGVINDSFPNPPYTIIAHQLEAVFYGGANGMITMFDPITGEVVFTPNPMTIGQDTICVYSSLVVSDGTNVVTYFQKQNNYLTFQDCFPVTGRIFLEGNYIPGVGMLAPDLRNQNLIPLNSPYETGETTTPQYLHMNNIVDWILIEYRHPDDASQVLAQQSALLSENGNFEVLPNFFGAATIAIKHRNHLGILTNSNYSIGDNIIFLDFVFSPGLSHGVDPMQSLDINTFGLFAGDSDQDALIGGADRSSAWNDRNTTGYLNTDYNLDGQVDAQDRGIAWNNRNKYSYIP